MDPLELKNQSFALMRNGELIAELEFDGTGAPALGPSFNPAQVRLFLAVMTLIVGEYPTPEALAAIILDVRPAPARPKPRELT